jgi:hypothetical protein
MIGFDLSLKGLRVTVGTTSTNCDLTAHARGSSTELVIVNLGANPVHITAGAAAVDNTCFVIPAGQTRTCRKPSSVTVLKALAITAASDIVIYPGVSDY